MQSYQQHQTFTAHIEHPSPRKRGTNVQMTNPPSIHPQGYTPYLDYQQQVGPSTNSHFTSGQSQPPFDTFGGPPAKLQFSAFDNSPSDQPFLAGSSGSAFPASYSNQMASRVQNRVDQSTEPPRFRPLPTPTPSTVTRNQLQRVSRTGIPPSSNDFPSPQGAPDIARLSTRPKSVAVRPLPSAPYEYPVNPESSSSQSTGAPDIEQLQQNRPLTLRDRILALQQSANPQTSLQRRALPQSPSAPPDLSQLPHLRRRGTLPEPPTVDSVDANTLFNTSYGHVQSPILEQVHRDSRVNLLIKRTDRAAGDNDLRSAPTQLESGPFQGIPSRASPQPLAEYQPLGINLPDSEEVPTWSLGLKVSLPSTNSIPENSTSTNQTASVRNTVNPTPKSPPGTKPIQGGPRRMAGRRREDVVSDLAPQSDILSRPIVQASQSTKLGNGSESLTFRMAAMTVGGEAMSGRAVVSHITMFPSFMGVNDSGSQRTENLWRIRHHALCGPLVLHFRVPNVPSMALRTTVAKYQRFLSIQVTER